MELLFSKPYTFSCDIFAYRVGLFEFALKPLVGKPNLKYLEIGVKEGQSLLWTLENIMTHESSTVTGIEINPLETLYKNIELSQQENKINLIKGDSSTKLREFDLNSFDAIYIDGHHSAKNVISDTIGAWPLLKENGYLIFDDYNQRPHWPIDQHPKEAIDLFITAFGDELSLLYRDYCVLIQKKPVLHNDSYYFSLIDTQHFYSWSSQKLFKKNSDISTQQKVKISSRETELIEEYLGFKKMGDPTPNPPKDFLDRFDFKAMVERLNLNI